MVLDDDRIDQEFLIPLRLTDNIPEDHMCFFVRDLVETYDFSQIHSKYKVLWVKMLIHGIC